MRFEDCCFLLLVCCCYLAALLLLLLLLLLAKGTGCRSIVDCAAAISATTSASVTVAKGSVLVLQTSWGGFPISQVCLWTGLLLLMY